MKLKHFAIAALAASAMGSVMAQGVTNSSSTATLLIMIADSTHSYTYDTGVSLASIENGTANFSGVLPNWASFNFAATTPYDPVAQAGVQWAAIGGTATSANQIAYASLVVSGTQDALNDGTLNPQYKNLGLKNDTQTLRAQSVNFENASGTVAASTDLGYAASQYFNLGYGGNAQAQALAAGSDTLGLYAITPVGTANNTFSKQTQESSIVTLNTATGQLTVGAVTAVPEPSSYALTLAGLACVLFIARRRRA